MLTNDILIDDFERIKEEVHATLNGLRQADLTFRPGPEANSIAWLIWHLTRIQDDHIASAAGTEQVWTADGWARQFNLPFDDASTGYGHTSQEVAAVQATPQQLLGYYDAVHARTVEYIRDLTDDDFNRIVDTSFDPPVTLATRVVSVVSDDLQHIGQAAFVRGLLPH